MGKLSDLFEGSKSHPFVTIAASLLAPTVVPLLRSAAKPLAKAIVKAGFLAYRSVEEHVAEATEEFHDLVAEVEAEMDESTGVPRTASRPTSDPSTG
ncbi:MAG: DUF5132 domain-containing protein [Nitrospira sp.]